VGSTRVTWRGRVLAWWQSHSVLGSLALPFLTILGVVLALADHPRWSLTFLLTVAVVLWLLRTKSTTTRRDLDVFCVLFLVIWATVLGVTLQEDDKEPTEHAGGEVDQPPPTTDVPTTETTATTSPPTTGSSTTSTTTSTSLTTTTTTVPPTPSCTAAGQVSTGEVRREMEHAFEIARRVDDALLCPDGEAFRVEAGWAQVLNGDESGPTGLIVEGSDGDADVVPADIAQIYQAFAAVTPSSSTTIQDAIVNAGVPVKPPFEYADGGRLIVVEGGALSAGDLAVIVVPPGDGAATFLRDQVLVEWALHGGPCGDDLGWPAGDQNELNSRPFENDSIVTLGEKVGLASEVRQGVPSRKHDLSRIDWDVIVEQLTACALDPEAKQ
jgi:hypothetical protein